MAEAARLEIKVGVDLAEARRTIEAFRQEQSRSINMGEPSSSAPYPAHSATSAAIRDQLPTLRTSREYSSSSASRSSSDDGVREVAEARREHARAIREAARAERMAARANRSFDMADWEQFKQERRDGSQWSDTSNIESAAMDRTEMSSGAVVRAAQEARGVGILGRRSRLLRYVAARMVIPGRAGMIAGLGFSALPESSIGAGTMVAGGAVIAALAAPILVAKASGSGDILRATANGGSPAEVLAARANGRWLSGFNAIQQAGVDLQSSFGSPSTSRQWYDESVEGMQNKTQGITNTLGVSADAMIGHWNRENEMTAARLGVSRIGIHDRFEKMRQESRDQLQGTMVGLRTERDEKRVKFYGALMNDQDALDLDSRFYVRRNGMGQITSIGGAAPGTADYDKKMASWRADFNTIAMKNPALWGAMQDQDNFDREYPTRARTAQMQNAATQEDINFQVKSAITQNSYDVISSKASREGDKLAASLARINKEFDVHQDKYGHITAFGDVTAKGDPDLFKSIQGRWDDARTQAGVDEQNRITRRQGSIASAGFALNDDPLDSHLAELQAHRKTELNGTTNKGEIASINSLYDTQEQVAKRNFAYGTVGIRQQLQWQRQGLQRGLDNDPMGEQIAGIMGSESQTILGLQQSGHGDQAGYAAENSRMQLQLSKKEYLNSFRGEQYDFRLMRPNPGRDVENPTKVMKEFDTAMKQATGMPKDLKSQVNRTQQGEGDLSAALAAIQSIPQAIKEAILAIASN